MATQMSRTVYLAFCLLLILTACGEADEPKGIGSEVEASRSAKSEVDNPTATNTPLPTTTSPSTATATATPEGWIALPTQRVGDAQMAAELYGLLVEENGCLWVEPGYPGHTGGNFLVIWPHGFTARDEGGQIVVRDAASDVAGRVGEEIYMGGGGGGWDTHGDHCSGQLWYAAIEVRVGSPPTPHPSAMGTYPPRPAPEELGATTIEYLTPIYDEQSGNVEVVLSRALTAEEIQELSRRTTLHNTRIDPTLCANGLRNDNWYCHPGSQPVLAIVRGDWWSGGVPQVHAAFIGVLYNVNDSDPVPILLETILSCNGAVFKPFLDDPNIPDEEPVMGC